MGKRDKQERKRKKREARLRQEKHLRHSAPVAWASSDVDPAWEADADEDSDADAVADARFGDGSAVGGGYLAERAARLLALRSREVPFADRAAAESYQRSLIGRRIDDVVAERADPASRAQELAYRSLEEPAPAIALRLAREAVALDASCVDAMVQVAVLANQHDVAAAIPLLRAAVATGEALIAGSDNQKGEAWGAVLSRPYLRARYQLANALGVAGENAESVTHLRALLDLDRGDHLGARYLCVGTELRLGNGSAARELIARFPHDPHAVFPWALVIERWLAGERAAAAAARRSAREANPFVDSLLTGADKPPRSSGLWRPGSRDEAGFVFVTLGAAALAAAGFIPWMIHGGHATTAEDRAAARAAYALPVAALLTLGECANQRVSTVDYPSRFGLRPAHRSELVRMATDTALHESDGDPALWAPVHACRALAHIPYPEAAERLLRSLADLGDDDWMGHEIVEAIAPAGAEAIPGCARVLADEGILRDVRHYAAEALGEIGQRHPDCAPIVIESLRWTLERYRDNDPRLNAFLIWQLMDLRATTAADLVRSAYAADAVDERVIGNWEEVEESFLG
ncbi:MAG: hypothetical protein H0V44_12230 [Planctomycetes bacterium]|nr:hypothetical protein [Planctomycetota bacterium]